MAIGVFEMFKLSFKALSFRIEQSRLTTSIYETIQTTKGAVKGVQRKTVWGDTYYCFEGIPYAKPPLGELRFRAPVPAEPWQGVKDCTKAGEKPMQAGMFFSKFGGSEDCLYLNVFTKNLKPDRPLPVMVWIYGGGFQIGESSRDMYSPDFFMHKDIILVTINYRLGAFGFLSLDDPAVNIPGNAGLKDQILSLRWIQENIRNFGGNPDNVTLFGESAGGTSTHMCIISPQSRGLVHKAIVMSGSALCPWGKPPNNDWGYRLAKIMGYTGENKSAEIYKYLMKSKAKDIVLTTTKVLDKDEKHNRILFAFGPVVEPYHTDHCVIPEEPYEMMKKTWSNEIPIMIGGTSFEGLLFYPEVTKRTATLDEVGNCRNLLPLDVVRDGPAGDVAGLQLKSAYFGEKPCSRETMYQFLELGSYREFWHPIYRTIRARQRHSTAPTYVYRFDFDSKEGNAVRNFLCGRGVSGVCHGDELCYMYLTIFSPRHAADSIEDRITRIMVDMWTSFATNGDPNCQRLNDVKFYPMLPQAVTANQQEGQQGDMQQQFDDQESPVKCLNISNTTDFIELPEMQKIHVWNAFYPRGKL